jgi:oligopeptide/dipeptide ABC transporter ATP-binding protein
MALILITHDVGVVAEVADRLLVMYAGRIIESGPTLEAFHHPAHPYTRALLSSIPPIDRRVPRLDAIPGTPPDPVHLPSGCPMHPRCAFVTERCRTELPVLSGCGPGRSSACHCVEDVLRAG